MKKTLLIICVFSLIASGCRRQRKSYLRIAAAANMQFAMDALTEAFAQETGVGCETIVGSSGKLTAQISEGAPFDLFVSADMKYPTELFDRNLTLAAPKIYAYGKLVLWTRTDKLEPSIELLTSDAVRRIALASPKTAPYGSAAIEALRHYDIFEVVEGKLVYGESIAQTNQFITSKAAEIGFTAKSVVLSPKIKGKGRWLEIDDRIYSPIAQGVVMLKKSRDHLTEAQQFYDFLFSKKGREILREYGYSIN